MASVLIRGKGEQVPPVCQLSAQTVRELSPLVQGPWSQRARVPQPMRPADHAVRRSYLGRAFHRAGSEAGAGLRPAKQGQPAHDTTTRRRFTSCVRAWTSTQFSASLGHVSLTTTNVYAEVDMQMKAKALANCEVEKEKEKHAMAERQGTDGVLANAVVQSVMWARSHPGPAETGGRRTNAT